MAWADYNKDSKTDLFITRGGLRAKMKSISEHFSENFSDELFEQTSDRFINITKNSGILKDGCPGYNTFWLDYDQDSHLDLFLTCHHNFPNKLYKNLGDGTFRNISKNLGLDHADSLSDTPFLWFDIENDGDLDLMLATESGIESFVNNNNYFNKSNTYSIHGVIKMSLNDYDNDGDLDIFSASYSGDNCILENRNNKFIIRRHNEIGLTSHSLYGSWIDFDNDGFTDIYLVPYGVFKQNTDKTFSKTGSLSFKHPKSIKRARSTWAGFDNDGDLDLLLAVYFHDPLWKIVINKILKSLTPKKFRLKDNYGPWTVKIYENLLNEEKQYYWVQILLKDYRSNTDAIGSKILLRHPNKRHILHVGQYEGSMTSQGHYRLYYGLGKYNGPINAIVTWPDNKKQQFQVTTNNRILFFTRNMK